MKSNLLFKILCSCAIMCFSMVSLTVHAQVSPCDADPFCSDEQYVFPNSISTTLPGGIAMGCLGSAPNPMWYYMQIGLGGPMQLTMVQTSATGGQLDIDFAMYGPFTDLTSGCAAVLAGAQPIQCSFSGSFTETIGLGLPGGVGTGATTPPDAIVGQVYIVLMTNYSQQPGSISFSQTAGTGQTDCGILCRVSATNNGPVCVGKSVNLSTINEDTANVYTYLWTDDQGSIIGNTENIAITPSLSGTFTYTLLAMAEGDTCITTTDVIINPYPSVFIADTSERVLCNMNSVTVSLANPSGFGTYQWFKDGQLMAGQTNSTIVMTDNGDYNIVGISDAGCADTSVTITAVFNFTEMDFDFSLAKACTHDTIKFNNLSEDGQYWWKFGDGSYPLDTAKNPNHIYNTQGSYIVSLTMTDLDGCTDSITKVVNTMHPLKSIFTASIDSVCQTSGTVVDFTNTSIGASTWAWDFGDGATSNLKEPSHVFTDYGNKQVRLVVGDDIPCYDTSYTTIYVDTMPNIAWQLDKDQICIGDKITIQSDYIFTAQELHWNMGDGTYLNEVSPVISHAYDEGGKKYVTVTADFPVCESLTLTDSVMVYTYPVVDLGPDSVMCLNGASIALTDTRNMNNPNISWKWNTGETTASITVREIGTYIVTATENDCASQEQVIVNKDCYTDIPNAFSPNGDGENDYFYPRQLLSKGVVGFTMQIFNRWGQLMFETSNTNGRGWDGRFNDQDQPSAVYVYTIKAVLKNGTIENYTGNVTLIR
jgi:gliding motility-associated-like protein